MFFLAGGRLAAAACALACALPGAAGATLTRVSGPSQVPALPDPCSPLATPLGERNHEFDPSLAVDPRDPAHLVASWTQDFEDAVAIATSFDGGRTWREQIPSRFLACANGPTSANSIVDSHVTIGADSAVYATATLKDQTANQAIVALASRDGGATWDRSATLDRRAPGSYEIEWNGIAADPARPGVAYALWDRHDGGVESPAAGVVAGGTERVARTDDGGLHWHEVAPVVPAGGGYAAIGSLAVTADGTIVVAFIEAPGTLDTDAVTRVELVRSSDGGAHWSDPLVLGEQAGAYPYLAVGPTRQPPVCVAWAAPGATGASLRCSTDGAASFDTARTYSAAGGARISQLSIALAPGRTLGLMHVDERDDGVQVSLARSDDLGHSFSEAAASAPFTPVLPYGSYNGLAALRDGFVGVTTLEGAQYAAAGDATGTSPDPSNIYLTR